MSLITQILTGVWLVTPEYKQGFLPIVKRVISGESLNFGEIKGHVKEREERYKSVQSQVPTETGSYYNGSFNPNRTDDRVGVIKINGVMIKDTDASTYGTDEAYDLLRGAGENENIVSVLLQMNTGGGYSDSAYSLFDIIKNFEARYDKPVFALVDNMAASAGYWAIAGASKIILAEKTASVGSIGVYGTILDYTEAFKMAGINVIEVYADESKDKNKDYREALEGNLEPYKQVLSTILKGFKTAVKTGRGEKINDDVFTGKMYYGNDAIKAGLADDIMSREDALDLAFRVGMKRKKKKSY